MALKKSVLFCCLLLWVVAPAAAEPSLTVTSSRGTVQFVRSNVENCSYLLFGAKSRKRFRRSSGILLSSEMPQGAEAVGVPQLRGSDKKIRLFFRVIERCGSTDTSSSVVRARFRGAKGKRLKGFAALLNRMSENLVESSPALKLTRIFSELSFSKPVALKSLPDGRIFVVEQGGIVSVIDSPAATTKKVFFDLTDKTSASGERGLLSIAFHPQYSTNRQFFVHYSDKTDGDTVIERYETDPSDPDAALVESGVEILRVEQPFSNHNGGEIEFGPDGYLYISLGDGGSGGDPLENGQNREVLLGKILRIDVDETSGSTNYAIPEDNPFFGNGDGFKEEIFAYGLRNVWKFSFDSATGDLWAGDVGQSTREEVDQITIGGNYGWNTTEGFRCFDPESDCDRTGLIDPVLDYPRTDGVSITGGYVYRGAAIPELEGHYLFGDFLGPDSAGGSIWSFPVSDSSPIKVDVLETDLLISAFGVDSDGELYVLSYGDGAIYRLEPEVE
ncbi:MAG: PQQ-dependent sugar dehydrogenase [Bdellovibrionales bacterium]|nr:PQQ-dependent sugar dehydrogenase [Bdellovibrionales bacterium]